MADKIIKLSIDVKKVNKAYLFEGKKGTYLNMTLFYNEATDEYGNNGVIVQDLPKMVKDLNSSEKGNILGNGKSIGKKIEPFPTTGAADDLPF